MMTILPLMLAAAVPQAAAPAADYSDGALWLCRPGRTDACSADQTATVVNADGTRATEPFTPAADPKFDCFYVYPTISLDSTPNSDLNPGPEERRTVQFQAARFGQVCRVFAPVYRQVTLAALRAVMMGTATTMDRALAYRDVKAAWDHYLANDNRGRGVVLFGHSQGSFVLKELIAREIEGKAVADRIVSAMLIGANVNVPENADVGGDFKVMPLCRSADQFGCVVSYVSFRDTVPPPANTRFGRAPAGQRAACTNPAALGGGRATMRAYLGAQGAGLGGATMGPWTADGAAVTTPFVVAPGLISAECVSAGGVSYLKVTVNADPADPRTDTIVGDVVIGPQRLDDWGLHLIDMNIGMGDMIALADRQARAWAARRR